MSIRQDVHALIVSLTDQARAVAGTDGGAAGTIVGAVGLLDTALENRDEQQMRARVDDCRRVLLEVAPRARNEDASVCTDIAEKLTALLGPPRMVVVESFTRGKHPDQSKSEDRWRDGEHFTVVVDGSTDKTGLRFNGRTGGWAVAELVTDIVASAPAGTSGIDLVAAINDEYARRLGADLADLPDHQRPSAVFVAFDRTTSRIVGVGDAKWSINGERYDLGVRGVDAAAADARAALLRCLLTGGASVENLRRDDPGRQMVMPLLLARAHARNIERDVEPYFDGEDELVLRHGVIDGRPVPADLITDESFNDPFMVHLASDGYPVLHETLQETETYLAADIADDPLRIGRHRGTKAIALGNDSFDDRTYVRLDRMA